MTDVLCSDKMIRPREPKNDMVDKCYSMISRSMESRLLTSPGEHLDYKENVLKLMWKQIQNKLAIMLRSGVEFIMNGGLALKRAHKIDSGGSLQVIHSNTAFHQIQGFSKSFELTYMRSEDTNIKNKNKI